MAYKCKNCGRFVAKNAIDTAVKVIPQFLFKSITNHKKRRINHICSLV